MKTKILIIVISFIFLCSVNVYAEENTENMKENDIFEEIDESLVTNISSQTLENTETNQYYGTMNLESPTYYKSYLRPEDNINIVGWAVSNDLNATVRLVVDGNIICNSINRGKRGDVDTAISPSYGGASLTPNAGFYYTLDTSNLSEGVHSIKVEEISCLGNILTSYETKIIISNKNFQGTMYVESPIYNKEFIRPSDTKINVSGWAVSNDSNANLKILVDGKYVQSNFTRTIRPDVDSAISPKYENATSKAGFSSLVDISSLDAGIHKIRVEQYSRYGDFMCSFETNIYITNKKYQGTMYVDSPTNKSTYIRPDQTQIDILGWAVSNDPNYKLKVLIDNKIVNANITRTKRPDIDDIIFPFYYENINNMNSGFSCIVNIQELNPGNHKIVVEEVSRYGDLICSYETNIEIVNKKYNGEMCIDTPTYNQAYNLGDNIPISGWAVSQDECAIVDIYIDGKFISNASRYVREDVKYYADKYDSKTNYPGFGKLINSNDFGVGTHEIIVYEKSVYGDIIGGVKTQFIVKSKQVVTNTPAKIDNNNNNNGYKIINNPTNNINTSGKKGIDVSQFQGTIDWRNVANSDVNFAMIRLGYRGYGTGKLAEDTKFKTNFYNSVSSGIKAGVYFYSTAINTSEAKKDAEYIVSILRKYGYQNNISMPIALDLELIPGVNTRDKNISKSMRTNIANTFCSTIASYGYTPMIYANKSFLNNNMYANQIKYDIWVAQYNSKCTYTNEYTMWQYTSSGKVSGINGNVDFNICYKNY